jgi:hypothetical protein
MSKDIAEPFFFEMVSGAIALRLQVQAYYMDKSVKYITHPDGHDS